MDLEETINALVDKQLAAAGVIASPRINDEAAVAMGVAKSVNSLRTMLWQNREHLRKNPKSKTLPYDLPPHTGERGWRTWDPIEIRKWQQSLPALGMKPKPRSAA